MYLTVMNLQHIEYFKEQVGDYFGTPACTCISIVSPSSITTDMTFSESFTLEQYKNDIFNYVEYFANFEYDEPLNSIVNECYSQTLQITITMYYSESNGMYFVTCEPVIGYDGHRNF